MRWQILPHHHRWATAHRLWEEPAEIDSAWYEAAFPPPPVHVPPAHRWSKNGDTAQDAPAQQRASSRLHAWLRRSFRGTRWRWERWWGTGTSHTPVALLDSPSE